MHHSPEVTIPTQEQLDEFDIGSKLSEKVVALCYRFCDARTGATYPRNRLIVPLVGDLTAAGLFVEGLPAKILDILSSITEADKCES